MGAAAAKASEDVATCGYDSYFEVVGCRASYGRCKKRGYHFLTGKITLFGVFYSELVDRAASQRRLYGF